MSRFETVFSCLISLPFLGLQSVVFWEQCISTHVQAKKDVFYRMKDNQGICQRNILWMFGIKSIMLAGTRGEGSDSPGCLILDDERANEMISRLLPQEPDLQNAA